MGRVAVVGTGYVGLTTGACLAHLGHDVVCLDVDADKVERLRRAEISIMEDGLDQLVTEGLRSGRLSFTTDIRAAVRDREYVCLCVPSPQADDGSADLSYIESAARTMAPFLQEGAIVINKSTVPVGSTRVVEAALGRDDVKVVSNPEFLREGSAVHDFLHPDRLVVGTDDEATALRLISLYVGLTAPVVVTDPASAELIKYAANAFLAAKLSFVNEVAALAEALGADMADVVLGVGSDPRIGRNHFSPGPGWGGSCLPKDTRALMRMAADAGQPFEVLDATVRANEAQFDRMADKLEDLVGGSLQGCTVAAWGVTFKGGTNDVRCSPALEVLQRVVARGATVRAHDPGLEAPTDLGAGIELFDDAYEACKDADVLALLTDWAAFGRADLDQVAGLLRSPRILDTRNLLDRAALERIGYEYRGVGRH
jgi:UDPglucose 6-dehydrogenase